MLRLTWYFAQSQQVLHILLWRPRRPAEGYVSWQRLVRAQGRQLDEWRCTCATLLHFLRKKKIVKIVVSCNMRRVVCLSSLYSACRIKNRNLQNQTSCFKRILGLCSLVSHCCCSAFVQHLLFIICTYSIKLNCFLVLHLSLNSRKALCTFILTCELKQLCRLRVRMERQNPHAQKCARADTGFLCINRIAVRHLLDVISILSAYRLFFGYHDYEWEIRRR